MDRWTTRTALAVAIAGLAGCGGQSPSTKQESGAQKGQYGVSFFVNVSRPVGGTITSGTNGKIDCGAVGTHDLCGPASYAWGDTAVLSAKADGGQYFQSWAGDCSGAVEIGGCRLDTLTYGADKWVVAVFNPPDQLGHSRIPDPAQHAPLFRAFIKSTATPDPGGVPQCTRCHGQDYNGLANAPSCTACHAAAGHPGWKTECSFCHGFPPPGGAHQTHFGLTGAAGTGAYGDLSILQDRYPGATPTTAPASYAFGCGNCHPATDPTRHMDGITQVSLVETGAPASSLKARNSATAAYDPATKTCSGVYCHSSGNEGSPIYVTTPGWLSTEKLACNGCHANPPRYASGGAGLATANSHLQLDNKGAPWGHYSFVMTDLRYTQHGRGNAPDFLNWSRIVYSDAAPITCQTCHFGTTDPSNTGPSRFYWLDTTGDYALANSWNYAYVCTSCHSASNAAAPVGAGRVLPLRHVNGVRDVEFDSRTGDPGASWVPSLDRPVRPYWYTQGSTTLAGWSTTNRTMAGTTAQFDLSPARYDPIQKTCTNVTCHISQGNTSYTGTGSLTRFEVLRWGSLYYASGTSDPVTGRTTCNGCHRTM
jgi:predicted CxxxxCH...CXXCH cytochrome family protein